MAERQLVLRNVVDEGPGVHRGDLLREAARFFGWARLGADIREALAGEIDALVAAGDLIESEGGLMPTEGSWSVAVGLPVSPAGRAEPARSGTRHAMVR